MKKHNKNQMSQIKNDKNEQSKNHIIIKTNRKGSNNIAIKKNSAVNID